MTDLTILTMAMPHIQAEIEKQKERIVASTVAQMRAGTLTPDQALFRWMEISAILGVGKTLMTKLKHPTTETGNG